MLDILCSALYSYGMTTKAVEIEITSIRGGSPRISRRIEVTGTVESVTETHELRRNAAYIYTIDGSDVSVDVAIAPALTVGQSVTISCQTALVSGRYVAAGRDSVTVQS